VSAVLDGFRQPVMRAEQDHKHERAIHEGSQSVYLSREMEAGNHGHKPGCAAVPSKEGQELTSGFRLMAVRA
jgi:hypothetical protein